MILQLVKGTLLLNWDIKTELENLYQEPLLCVISNFMELHPISECSKKAFLGSVSQHAGSSQERWSGT